MVPIDRPKHSTQHVCLKFSLVCSRHNPKNTDMVIFSVCPGVTFQSNKIKNFISLTLPLSIAGESEEHVNKIYM